MYTFTFYLHTSSLSPLAVVTYLLPLLHAPPLAIHLPALSITTTIIPPCHHSSNVTIQTHQQRGEVLLVAAWRPPHTSVCQQTTRHTRQCHDNLLHNHPLNPNDGYRHLKTSLSLGLIMVSSLLDNSSLKMGMTGGIRRRQSIGLNRAISSKDKDRDTGSSKEADMESLLVLDEECKQASA